GKSFPDSDLLAVTAFARTAAASEALGGDRAVEVTRTLAKTGQSLDQAVELARAGDRDHAKESALDAYLAFERIETPLRARNSAAASDVERAFGGLQAAIAQGGDAEVTKAREGVNTTLLAAQKALTTEADAGMLFGQSFVIMVREGLEAILI